jgi:AcrR family transcriptional regulator
LAEGGPDAVRVEALARRLGVSKGGFYWHFDDRGALLDEMLESWERRVVDEVVDVVESGGGDARARLATLFSMVTSGVRMSDLAIRDWARRDRAVARRLRRVDNRRMEYMRALFREFCSDEADVEARCLLAMGLFIGTHFTAADHGRRTRKEVLAVAAQRLLL